jgi:hypothetical protein
VCLKRVDLTQNVKVQLLTVDHSAHRSMKNRASSDKRCELQDTPNTRFSNAHCTFGSFPKVRLSEGRNKIETYQGSHRETSTCCYTFVEHEMFSVIDKSAFCLPVLYGIKAAISGNTTRCCCAFSPRVTSQRDVDAQVLLIR